MADMADLLAELNRPRMVWFSAVVSAVDTGGTVSLSYSGGTIVKASRLASYTPQVGDRVEVLSYEPMGVLVLGKNTASTVAPAAPAVQIPIIVSSSTRGTYDQKLNTWDANILAQGPGKTACVFYSGGFSALVGRALQSVEIELSIAAGGPPDFVGVQNAQPIGVPNSSGVPYRVTPTFSGWLPLPIWIGQALVAGTIRGVAITSSGQTGTYTGSGRVRLTPLSVTI